MTKSNFPDVLIVDSLADHQKSILSKYNKFHDLVWAARKPCIDAPVEEWEYFANTDGTGTYRKSDPKLTLSCRTALQKIVDKYPEDYSLLKGKDGQFHHGFNSGALAAFRYVLDIIETGVEHAEEEFPNLDT